MFMDSKFIKVLDHGHVGLVDCMGNDLSIVRNARVSYDAEWRTGENEKSDAGLIRYLYSNGHSTPFESVVFTFDIKMPIFVFRQHQRHRTQAYNELSARYRELPEQYYIPEPHLIGVQNKDNKQMRDIMSKEEFELLSVQDQYNAEKWCELWIEHHKLSFNRYRAAIAQGVPRELARGILGMGTYSHMFATVSLHNLFNFLLERLHAHAQYEIRMEAQAMLELIEPIVPVAVKAFKKKVAENDAIAQMRTHIQTLGWPTLTDYINECVVELKR